MSHRQRARSGTLQAGRIRNMRDMRIPTVDGRSGGDVALVVLREVEQWEISRYVSDFHSTGLFVRMFRHVMDTHRRRRRGRLHGCMRTGKSRPKELTRGPFVTRRRPTAVLVTVLLTGGHL